MKMVRKFTLIILSLGLMVSLLAISENSKASEKKKDPLKQYVAVLLYRTGPFAAGGSGLGSAWEDYMQLQNMKGGVNGVMYDWEECETAYSVPRAIECYERVKDKNPAFIQPFSTGAVYAMIPRGVKDHVPMVFIGYGRADAADGRVFKWAYNFPVHYWSLNTCKIKFIAKMQGWDGKNDATMGKYLKGLKIANLHIDVPYGQETKPILDTMAKKYGFTVRHFPVSWPGIDQKAQWMDIARRFKADWAINRNWGVSCMVALKESARVGFPRDRIIGVWWCSSEEDALPAGAAAKGYNAANFHGVGKDFPLVKEIVDKVYGAMKGNISFTRVGTVYYNRGLIYAIIMDEAFRTAHKKFGVKVINGDELRWAFENLNITKERIKEIGAEGLMQPLKTSWKDHEGSDAGGGEVQFHKWDGLKWVPESDWIAPMKDYVRGLVEASAVKYAKEKGIKIRTSPED